MEDSDERDLLDAIAKIEGAKVKEWTEPLVGCDVEWRREWYLNGRIYNPLRKKDQAFALIEKYQLWLDWVDDVCYVGLKGSTGLIGSNNVARAVVRRVVEHHTDGLNP